MPTNREAMYDEQIAPLMKQIIALCKEHDIPIVAAFQLDDDRDNIDPEQGRFLCTTAIVPKNVCKDLHDSWAAVRPRRSTAFTITTTKADGSKIIERVL